MKFLWFRSARKNWDTLLFIISLHTEKLISSYWKHWQLLSTAILGNLFFATRGEKKNREKFGFATRSKPLVFAYLVLSWLPRERSLYFISGWYDPREYQQSCSKLFSIILQLSLTDINLSQLVKHRHYKAPENYQKGLNNKWRFPSFRILSSFRFKNAVAYWLSCHHVKLERARRGVWVRAQTWFNGYVFPQRLSLTRSIQGYQQTVTL